jgi:hypothetical protein
VKPLPPDPAGAPEAPNADAPTTDAPPPGGESDPPAADESPERDPAADAGPPSPSLAAQLARARALKAAQREEKADAAGLPSSRGLAVRLLALSALFFWAMTKIGPGVDAPEGHHALLVPKGWTRPAAEGAAPDLVDVLGAVTLLEGVAERAAVCPAYGVVRVTLGAEGLVAAELDGGGEILCVAKLVWEASWPRGTQQLELEQQFGQRPGSID